MAHLELIRTGGNFAVTDDFMFLPVQTREIGMNILNTRLKASNYTHVVDMTIQVGMWATDSFNDHQVRVLNIDDGVATVEAALSRKIYEIKVADLLDY